MICEPNTCPPHRVPPDPVHREAGAILQEVLDEPSAVEVSGGFSGNDEDLFVWHPVVREERPLHGISRFDNGEKGVLGRAKGLRGAHLAQDPQRDLKGLLAFGASHLRRLSCSHALHEGLEFCPQGIAFAHLLLMADDFR